MYGVDDGVYGMSEEIEGLVESCCKLGWVKMGEGKIVVVRSEGSCMVCCGKDMWEMVG